MSEVFDEATGEFRKRTLSNWQVLGFISRYGAASMADSSAHRLHPGGDRL